MVALVHRWFENLHTLLGDDGAVKPTDEFFGFTGKHATTDYFDPAGASPTQMRFNKHSCKLILLVAMARGRTCPECFAFPSPRCIFTAPDFMEEKINHKAIEIYAQAFAGQVCETFFSKSEKITGPEILAFTPIRQVNLFIVRDLMVFWKSESEKWRNPYFNFDAPEVVEVISQLKNVISNHILIARRDFEPLVKGATIQTLSLLLSPYDFFANVLDRQGKSLVRITELRNDVKYLKINQAPLEKLLAKMEESLAEVLPSNEALALLDHILEEVNFTPEDVDVYLNSFAKILPLAAGDFFEPVIAKAPPMPPTKETYVAKEPTVRTLADNLARQKGFLIKENLTINQKFMFTKILFSGDFEIFSESINRLDSFDNFDQAMKFVRENFPHWDLESEEYEEFIEILQKRFS